MASIEQLEAGLRAAMSAGNTDYAKIIGAEILKARKSSEIDPTYGEGNIAPKLPRSSLDETVDKIAPTVTSAYNMYDKVANVLPGIPNTQEVVDLATGASQLMRGGANLISGGIKAGDKIWPKEMSTGGGYETLGKLADPVAWTTGGTVAKALPYAKVFGNGLQQGLLNLGKNLTGGAIAGGTIGALDEDMSAGEGAGIGAAMNTMLPPLLSGGYRLATGAKNLLTPNPVNIAVKATGDKLDDVVTALTNSRSGTSGLKLNAGQASVPSGSAEFAALQKLVDKSDPSSSVAFNNAQKEARIKVLEAMSGTQKDLSTAIANRSNKSNPLYQAAREGAPVDISASISMIDDVLARNPANKELSAELSAIRKLLMDADGNPLVDPEQVSSIFPTIKSALAKPENAFIGGNLKAIRDKLRDAIPGINQANKVFADESIPINRMQVARELQNRLVGGGKETPSTFVRAMDDTTPDAASRILKKATGEPRGSLSGIMGNDNMQKLQAVQDDLLRDIKFKELASAGKQSMEDRIGAAELPPTGIFQPMLSAARGWFNRASGNITDKGIKELSAMMQNPQQLAVAMKALSPKQRIQVELMLQKMMQTSVPAMTGASQ